MLDSEMPDREDTAYAILDEAQALLESYAGVQVVSRLVRERSAGRAIVDESARRDAELVMLGASRGKVRGGKPIFGRTVDFVLRNSPTRVAVDRREEGGLELDAGTSRRRGHAATRHRDPDSDGHARR